MAKAPTLEGFQNILSAIVSVMMAQVESELKDKPWVLAYLDVRGSADSTCWLEKFRIELPDGSVIATLDPPFETGQLLLRAWKIKDKVFPDKWYGVKIVIYPGGKCQTEFNYDPECVSDPDFFAPSKAKK